MKNLPVGAWISLYDLDAETTEQEIIDAVASRTGVRLEESQIDIRPHRLGAAGIVVFKNHQIRDLLTWALQDDTVHGLPFKWRIPGQRPKDSRA